MPSIPLSKILAASKWNGKRACGDLQRPTMLFHLPPCHPWCQMSAHMKNGLADDSWLMGSIPGTKVMWVQQQRQIEGVKGEEKSHCQSRCCWNSIQSLQRACNAADTYFLYVYVMCSLTLAYHVGVELLLWVLSVSVCSPDSCRSRSRSRFPVADSSALTPAELTCSTSESSCS